MKKLVIALAIMFVVAANAAEFKWPGWNCKDVTQLQEQLALAPTDEWKMNIAVVLACAQNQPADFAAACVAIDNVITALKPDATDQYRLDRKKQYASCTGQWITEAWQFCKANPSSYDIYYMNRTPAQLGETADGYCEQAYRVLTAGVNNPANAGKLIKNYCSQLPLSSIPRTERFAKLQMLNDIYTAKLIDNKTAWGDVIAQIRTVMELYK